MTRDLPAPTAPLALADAPAAAKSARLRYVNDSSAGITLRTAKDVFTCSGTVLAALALREFEIWDSDTRAKKNIVRHRIGG